VTAGSPGNAADVWYNTGVSEWFHYGNRIGERSMPLLDHFHPPLLGRRHWEGSHSQWAAAMSDMLNQRLPANYFAEFQVKLGTRIEVEIAVETRAWAPATATAVMPAVFPDDFEIQVFSGEGFRCWSQLSNS
jgi:hypothetical protein